MERCFYGKRAELKHYFNSAQTIRSRKHPEVYNLFFISSPEHKVLRVSYCDLPLSVVRRTSSSIVRRASTVVRKLLLLKHLLLQNHSFDLEQTSQE